MQRTIPSAVNLMGCNQPCFGVPQAYRSDALPAKRLFFKMLPSVTCGRKQRAPVFKSTCFSNRSKTASYPPLVTTWLDKSAAIGLFFSLREGFSLFPLGIGSFLSSRQLYIFALCYPRLDNGTDTSHPYADTRLLAKCDCPVFSRIEISPQKKGTPNLRPYHSTSLVLRIGLP